MKKYILIGVIAGVLLSALFQAYYSNYFAEEVYENIGIVYIQKSVVDNLLDITFTLNDYRNGKISKEYTTALLSRKSDSLDGIYSYILEANLYSTNFQESMKIVNTNINSIITLFENNELDTLNDMIENELISSIQELKKHFSIKLTTLP